MTKKVLVVDDSAYMRALISNILSKLLPIEIEYKIVETDGMEEALNYVQTMNPDLVFLDLMLQADPKAGVKGLKDILSVRPSTPVVVITSLSQDCVRKECLAAGAKAFYSKPFQMEEIADQAQKFLTA